MRAALIFTGHLRGTCDRDEDKGLRTLQQQAEHCRAAFDVCDIFLHTWDWLEKPLNFSELQHGPRKKCGQNCRTAIRLNASSWPCVSRVVAALNPAAVTVERQDRWQGYEVDARMWNSAETLRNFRMNGASMYGGADLVRRHSHTMNHTYVTAVRMRAEVGSANIDLRGAFKDQFLTNRSWLALGRYAVNYSQPLANPFHRQVMTCDIPRIKRIDFCSWSIPADPLLDTLQALKAHLAGNPKVEDACRLYLTERFQAPFICGSGLGRSVFSESVLFCAMHAAGVNASSWLTKHDLGSRRCYSHRPQEHKAMHEASHKAQAASLD